MARHTNPASPDQFDLFAVGDTPAPARQCAAPPTPTRTAACTPSGMTPGVAVDILTDITSHTLGLLDDTDRVVTIDRDTGRAREIHDADVVHHLIATGYAERSPRRDTVDCKWGITRKPVTPLRLTATGRALLTRWTALRPLRTT